MSSGSTTWTAGSSRRSSSSSKAGPSGSRPSPPPWARIPVRSKMCTSRFSCNAASWPARRAAAAPPEPRTSILGSLRPEPRTSKRSSTGRQSRYRTSDFNYSLPAGRIAQHPLPDRAASRLLVLDRSTDAIRHAQFRDIVELVAPEDVLVLNVSRAIPARLHGKRETGNVAELLVVRELPDGSVAAPTAGLHFTAELVDRVRASGTAVATLDLHVGPGTFKPVEVDDLAGHALHAEPYAVSAESATTINGRREAGGRIWAVGTTVVRALETCADARGAIRPGAGETSLFIYPPYPFRAVDRLLTNFHLPRSTLLMLVCAFGGYDNVMRAYGEAMAIV